MHGHKNIKKELLKLFFSKVSARDGLCEDLTSR